MLASKIGGSSFDDNCAIIFIGQDCVDHQCHLPVKVGLLLIDSVLAEEGQDWRYFASVAKCVNVWRDSAKPLYKSWEAKFGRTQAFTNGRKLPPRCLAGRWMSVSNAEERLIDVEDELPAAVRHCFSQPHGTSLLFPESNICKELGPDSNICQELGPDSNIRQESGPESNARHKSCRRPRVVMKATSVRSQVLKAMSVISRVN